eukprot:scaffold104526_cov53-Phaeocystis_antarctica.AAC.1
MCTVPSARDEIQLSQSATQARQTVRAVGTVCGIHLIGYELDVAMAVANSNRLAAFACAGGGQHSVV